MKALKRKWNSRQGASILLALLFLLVCMMAGASILMAAASNAGKIDSNKTEQQKYLAVSSAMTMLVEELQKAEYVGNYTYEQKPHTVTIQVPVLDEDGNQRMDGDGNPMFVPQEVVDYYIHIYTQEKVTFTGNYWLDAVLPLREHFDYVFDSQFEVPASERTPGDGYIYNSLTEQAKVDSLVEKPTDPGSTYKLTFQAPDGYGGLNVPVEIEVKLRADGSILLTGATKDEDDAVDFTMKALLNPKTDGDVPPDKLLVLSAKGTSGPYTTGTIKWELEYIFKEEA